MPEAKEIHTIHPEYVTSGYWKDVWRHRELIVFLAWRDILVRYKQTIIGLLWTLIRPLMTIFAFAFVFGLVARVPSGDYPYALIALTGILPWQLFSVALSTYNDSIIANTHIVSKVYFPRIIIPISITIVMIFDSLLTMVLLVGALVWFQHLPGITILLLPLAITLASLCALGMGLIVAALNVKFRDFRQLIPFVLLMGMFGSPVAYATNLVPANWLPIYVFNPVVGIIDLFRLSVLGDPGLIASQSIPIACAWTAFVLVAGIKVFRRLEPTFADTI